MIRMSRDVIQIIYTELVKLFCNLVASWQAVAETTDRTEDNH